MVADPMLRFYILVAAFVSAMAFALVYTQATLIPPPTEPFDRNQVRVISETETTSTCIGDPRTPLCAVETFLACSPSRLYLCEQVGVFDFGFHREPTAFRYRVRRSVILRERDTKIRLRSADWNKPGIATVTLEAVYDNSSRCLWGCNYYYSVKRMPDGWKIISWTSDGDTL